MLGSYTNSNEKMHLVCPEGHDYYVRYNNWKHKVSRCVKCSAAGTSSCENLIKEFLKDYDVAFEANNKTLIAPYELDIVIPDKKFAIEYCGLYWHSELLGKDRKYHINKLDMCLNNGYKLITIFEDELLFNKSIVFSRLKNMLGFGNLTRIYARKCSIEPIDASTAREFCEANHLQGYTGSFIKLGAFYDGELVSVMTFAKPSIAKGSKNVDGVWELSRFCSKINYKVIGIASKLLCYFERNYNWKEIFSYADRRWSSGEVYDAIGFTFTGVSSPNYWYIKNKRRLHRFALRKNREDYQELTEWQNRQLQGWNRIWDCGNLKYVKSN
jgi:hypothetical protein